MLYLNKLIDICINRQESQEVVNNYDNGSNLNKFRRLLLKMIQYINIAEITENTAF